MIGKILGDRYKISEKIGGGGMADVYKAHDNKLEREVAVKILKREFINDSDFVDKFKKESHAAAKLNHTNIVGIYDVGSEIVDGETVYYIVMEIVEGITLKELIKRKSHLSVKETIYYTLQIADALINAHDNHIVHRDIKPQNIIINKDNTAKVTDFGIAKAANNVTVSSNNDILGSVHYFSPEQARGESTDQRSDIYSLGICMYEMLTGELPFDAENPISIALMQIQEPIKKPSSVYSNIPSELDRIVMKMTEKDKKNRYSNLRDVVEDIKNLEVVQDMDIAETMVLPKIQNANAGRDVSVDEQRRIRRSSTDHKNKSQDSQRIVRRENKTSIGKSFFSILSGILVALLVATGGFYLFFNWWSTRPAAKEIEVPDIIGVQEEEAKKIIEERGLQFEVSERLINHEFDNNDVIYQSVAAGEKVKEGYKIRVTINDLPETLSVEDYKGKKFDDISQDLKDKGFLVETKFVKVDDEEEIGTILEQSPDVGSEVKLGSTLKLTIGKETEVKTVTMPDVRGFNIQDAKEILEGKNLEIGKISQDYSDKYDKKDIMSQSVDPKDEVEEGTKIDLTVVIGNLEDKKNAENESILEDHEEHEEEPDGKNSDDITKLAIGIPIPQDKEKTTIKIVKIENGKKETIYEKDHKADETAINITVEGSKDAIYELYYDDKHIETYP